MVGDADPVKWQYSEHTRSKHELLEKYLGGWMSILGSWHRRLLIVDGFAGKGEYDKGEDGSPVIIHRKASELIAAGKVDQVICVFIEENETNFRDLRAILDVLPTTPGVIIESPRPASFESVVKRLFEKYPDGIQIPSFWFIDPFGYSDFSFETVSKIMSLERSEVFVNFMVSFLGRFLNHPNLEATNDQLFGSTEWRNIVKRETTGEAKEHALRDLYMSRLQEIGCRVTNFRLCADDRRQTLYYLMHAAKHQRAVWLMRSIMAKQGPAGIFAYLGPEDSQRRYQESFLPIHDPLELKAKLLIEFKGRTLTYTQFADECSFDGNEHSEPDYRKAVQALEAGDDLRIDRVESKKTGLKGKDRIIFP